MRGRRSPAFRTAPRINRGARRARGRCAVKARVVSLRTPASPASSAVHSWTAKPGLISSRLPRRASRPRCPRRPAVEQRHPQPRLAGALQRVRQRVRCCSTARRETAPVQRRRAMSQYPPSSAGPEHQVGRVERGPRRADRCRRREAGQSVPTVVTRRAPPANRRAARPRPSAAPRSPAALRLVHRSSPSQRASRHRAVVRREGDHARALGQRGAVAMVCSAS